MGTETKISWCDHTHNPWIGCTKVSDGCDHCYAETLNHRWGNDNWGKGKPRRITSDANWKLPLKWDKEAYRLGRKDKVFCASLADVMDDEAPEGQRERLWELIDNTPNLIWQLLTKRPQRYVRYLPKEFKHCNVWLGMSAENQENFEIRADHLIDASVDRGTLAFISYEPALGPLTLSTRPNWQLDWLICGGESGNDRRPMEQSWVENIRRECAERGTKFFMKQMSARTPEIGASLIPAHLLVRQFPGEQA
jgi:protein gp37